MYARALIAINKRFVFIVAWCLWLLLFLTLLCVVQNCCWSNAASRMGRKCCFGPYQIPLRSKPILKVFFCGMACLLRDSLYSWKLKFYDCCYYSSTKHTKKKIHCMSCKQPPPVDNKNSVKLLQLLAGIVFI